jgi:hypothetical protein
MIGAERFAPDQPVWLTTRGYIMLELPQQPKLQEQIALDGLRLHRKREFHMSVMSTHRVADSTGVNADAIAQAVHDGLLTNPLELEGFTDRLYVCHKGENTSVIGLVAVRNALQVFELVRHKFGFNKEDLPDPAPHATLYTAGSPYGIAVPSQAELANLCEPLTGSVAQDIYDRLEPKAA